jgi:hypothetical protein
VGTSSCRWFIWRCERGRLLLPKTKPGLAYCNKQAEMGRSVLRPYLGKGLAEHGPIYSGGVSGAVSITLLLSKTKPGLAYCNKQAEMGRSVLRPYLAERINFLPRWGS